METEIRGKQLEEYILETLTYMQTVQKFCKTHQDWLLHRKKEQQQIRDIKSSAEKFFGRFKMQELEKKLKSVLWYTVEGLNRLQHFHDTVEKLAVTSMSLFKDEVFKLEGVCPESVQTMISMARIVCPVLIHFKRDARTFFIPSMSNVEVLDFHLEKYILITPQLCETLSKKTLEMKGLQLKHSGKFTYIKRDHMKNRIDRLSKLRMDESFRLSFIFGENNQRFMDTYTECRSRMFQFLSDLEGNAVQLDKMKKGSSISTVAGSSVGIAGSVFSIVGLALAPVTAGASLALTITGVGLGVTSAANSVVTAVTEVAVNEHHRKNANDIFQTFMKDVQKILECLDQVSQQCPILQLDKGEIVLKAGAIINSLRTTGSGIDSLVDGVSAVRNLSSEKVVSRVVTLGLHEGKAAQNIPNLAADLPDIGQLAKGTPLALSKAARFGLISLNSLCIGLDVFLICKESVNLAKGEKSEQSQIIRSRSALWKAEIESWEKIHDCLCKGKETFQDNMAILDQ